MIKNKVHPVLSFIFVTLFSLCTLPLEAQHNMLINVSYANFGFSKPMLGAYTDVTVKTKGFELYVSLPYFDYSTQTARDLKDNTDDIKGYRHMRGGLSSTMWSGPARQRFFSITGEGYRENSVGNWQGSDGKRYSYYIDGYNSFQDAKASLVFNFGIDYMRTAAKPDIDRNYIFSNVTTTSAYFKIFYGKSSNLYSSGFYADLMYAPSLVISKPVIGGISREPEGFIRHPMGIKAGYEFFGKYFSSITEIGTVPGVRKNRFIVTISVGFPLKF